MVTAAPTKVCFELCVLLLLMEEIRKQLIGGVHPTIYKGLYLPGAGFLNHQQYHLSLNRSTSSFRSPACLTVFTPKMSCRCDLRAYLPYWPNCKTRWWFQIFLFSSLPGEMIQFDEHIFQGGWNHQLENQEICLGVKMVRFNPCFLFAFSTPWVFEKW